MLAMFGMGHGFQFDMEENYRFVSLLNTSRTYFEFFCLFYIFGFLAKRKHTSKNLIRIL